ncbi:hypothetical protein EV683_11436 [Crenobacter luteus]|uniref:Ig-like domain-containing protein n=1 Tax=Crenobacter luteus TaxID=1452487 RepID=UPI001049C678|nr:Ig-like domain-containing protein [Crenobacter luteus]TCP11220.1 hypothetical protein EV683_11436 [Crenobacter luteus]
MQIFKPTLLALSVCLGLHALSAQAELARVGPIDRANGYPQWYQDTTGLALDSCVILNQTELSGGWCLLLPQDVPGGRAPEVFPGAFADEHFYWSANAGAGAVPVGNGQTMRAQLVLALEAAFGTGPVAAGDQVVFTRLRIRLDPLPFDGSYTVYTPYGKFEFPDQVAGGRLFFTEDIGLTPGGFTEALNGNVGPFLLPSPTPGGAELPPIPNLKPGQDPFYDALVAGGGATPYPGGGKKYIADPARLGPVTGSPRPDYVVRGGATRNANIFRVEGPNGFVYETTDFALSGRLYDGAIAGALHVDRASYTREGSANQVNVFATAFPITQGRTPAGPPPATVATQLSYFDAPCTPTLDANGNPVPPYSAPANAAANPMSASGSRYFGRSAPATLPSELCVRANTVNASGQASSSYLPVQLGDQILIDEAIYDPSSRRLSVAARSGDRVAAQVLTVSGLGTIDATTGRLVVDSLLAPPDKVTVLSSGGGLNALQVSLGNVAGGVNVLPLAQDDAVSMHEDCSTAPSSTPCAAPVVIDVLANDSNVAGGTVSITSAPLLGTATVTPDGRIAYTPKLNANGNDRIGYRVTVGNQVSNEAGVAIAIAAVNDTPTAVNDTTQAVRGVANVVNVFANDSDPDGAGDLARALIVTGNASLGIVSGASYGGGVVDFTPPATTAAGNYNFTYRAVDQAGAQSAPATVTVTVSAGETITAARARYTQSKGRWDASGTASPASGQTLTLRYADGLYRVNGICSGNANGTAVGTAVVDAAGAWAFDLSLGSTVGILNPSNTGNSAGFWCTLPRNLRVTSSLGGGVTVPITLK